MEGAPDRRPTAEVQILQCTWKEAVKKSPLALLRAYTHLQKVRPSLLSSECLLRTPRIRYCSPLSPLLWSAIARTDAGPVAIKTKLQHYPWFKLESSKQAEEKAAVAEAAATEKSKKRSAAPAGETSGTVGGSVGSDDALRTVRMRLQGVSGATTTPHCPATLFLFVLARFRGLSPPDDANDCMVRAKDS